MVIDRKSVLVFLLGALACYVIGLVLPSASTAPVRSSAPCPSFANRDLSPPEMVPRPPETPNPPKAPRASVPQILAWQKELMVEYARQYPDTTNKTNELEGHSGAFPQKLFAYRALTYGREIKTICEIGFNLGHSSVAWLASNPGAHLYSFDYGNHEYRQIGIDLINRIWPNKLTLTTGDSQVTVPEFFKKNPGIFCDVAHVDGGHTYEIATNDLNNFGARVTKGGILIIDDTNCVPFYCVDKAWKDYLNKTPSALPIIEVLDLPGNGSGFSAAYMNDEEPRPLKFF